MKKLIIAIITLLVVMSFSIDLYAMHHPQCPTEGPVGAPLDGGLLAVLGAAGIAYYIARKKKAEK